MAEKQFVTTQELWLEREVAELPPITDEQWAALVEVVAGSAPRREEPELGEPTGEYFLG